MFINNLKNYWHIELKWGIYNKYASVQGGVYTKSVGGALMRTINDLRLESGLYGKYGIDCMQQQVNIPENLRLKLRDYGSII